MNLFDKLIEQYDLHKNDKVDYSVKNNTNEEERKYLHSDYFKKTHTEEEIISLLGQRWKKNVANLAALVDLYKYITWNPKNHDGYVNEISIAQTSDFCKQVFGSVRNASKVINMAVKIDLLCCVDDSYQYNGYNESYNKCKKYILNKDIQSIIISIANNNNITHKYYIRNNIIYNSGTELKALDKDLFDKVKINSCLRIADAKGYPGREEFERDCNIVLEQKYPQLVVLKEEANKINNYPFYREHPELQVKVEPHFTYSRGGLLTKIGLRATNKVVSLKEHDNGVESGKIWRKDYLNELFEGQEYQSYDVKASIYQLTHALNTNDWLNNSVDMYREIYGQEFSSKEQRDKFKSLCMPLYFDKSLKKTVHHLNQKAKLSDVMTESEYTYVIGQLRQNMMNALGCKTYDSEIFLHESVIYNHVTLELVKKGWKIVQVYDGFYGISKDRNLNVDIDSILTKYIKYYISKYINNNIIYNSGTELEEINFELLDEGLLSINDDRPEPECIIDEEIDDFFDRVAKEYSDVTHTIVKNSFRMKSKWEIWMEQEQNKPSEEQINNAYEMYSDEWYDAMLQNDYMTD